MKTGRVLLRVLLVAAAIGALAYFLSWNRNEALPDGAKAGAVGDVRYIEMLVGGAGPDDALPMIIAIHGRGGSPSRFAHAFDDFPIPARVILPYGFERARTGYQWFGQWRDDQRFGETLRGVANRLAPMIKEVATSRAAVGKPIVVGFSQGGMLSFALAVLHPEAVHAAVPVSGSMARSLVPATWPIAVPMPRIFAIHGTADGVVPIDDDRETIARLKTIGMPVELAEVSDGGHEVSPRVRELIVKAMTRALKD